MGIDGIFPNGLALDEAIRQLLPMLAVVLGITAYAVFVFHFYRFVAARDMFSLNLSGNGEERGSILGDVSRLLWWVVRFVFLYPAFASFWFAVLTLVLAFLSEGRELSGILLIAAATVSVIRISAYYKEDLSRDLAKIVPFAVLSFFIVSTNSLDAIGSLAALMDVSEYRETIVYYLLFLVALEIVLRFLFVIFKLVFPGKAEDKTYRGASAAPPTPPPSVAGVNPPRVQAVRGEPGPENTSGGASATPQSGAPVRNPRP